MKNYRFLSILLVLIGLGFLYLRFGQPSQADASVTHVTPTPTPYHRTCRDRSCVRVAGHGESSCEESEDCHASPSATPTPTIEVCSEIYTHEQGDCVTPTPPVPTPTVDPCGDGQCVTPTPEPTQPPTGGSDPGPAGVPQAPNCPNFWPVGPSTFWFTRLSPTSINVKWTQVDQFVNDFVVSYGPTSNTLLWTTTTHGTEVTLNFLPANQHIWVGVKELSQGCTGNFGLITDP